MSPGQIRLSRSDVPQFRAIEGSSRGELIPKPALLFPTHVHLYCTIRNPRFGCHFDWVFTINDRANNLWHTFGLIQDTMGGPFRKYETITDPRDSHGCREPLLYLGSIFTVWLQSLIARVRAHAVSNPIYWNSQDYVLEIWRMVHDNRFVDKDDFDGGRQWMMLFYRQVIPEEERIRIGVKVKKQERIEEESEDDEDEDEDEDGTEFGDEREDEQREVILEKKE